MMPGLARTAAAVTALLALSGCLGIGAQRIGIDRSDYSNHLRETNKEQLLLNIVAMRYGDAPLFLEVSSVISQYTRESSASAGIGVVENPGDSSGSIGGSVLLRETPTITYTPLSGDRFSRGMLSPIPPASLLAMMEAGWSADYLFPLAVRSINGVRNGGGDPLFAEERDTDFAQVVAAMGRLQRGHGLVVHVEKRDGNFLASARIPTNLSERDKADLALLTRVLRLPGDGRGQFSIVFAADQAKPDELAIGSRSMFEIFSEMAQGVQIPESDRDGRTVERKPGTSGGLLLQVHSGKARPPDAHVAVRYRDHWFWIDGRDVTSKRMFLLAQILLSLNDTTAGANAPLVTVSTG
jgi:hypothetical protein